MAGSRVKRAGARTARRPKSRRRLATRPKATTTSKAREIVRLVDALVDGLGAGGRARLGRGIASMMADAYGGHGQPLPRWVRDLIAYYAPRNGGR